MAETESSDSNALTSPPSVSEEEEQSAKPSAETESRDSNAPTSPPATSEEQAKTSAETESRDSNALTSPPADFEEQEQSAKPSAETESRDSSAPTSTVSSNEQEKSAGSSLNTTSTEESQPVPRPVPQQFGQGQRILQLKRYSSPLYTPHYNHSDWAFFSVLLLVTLLAVGTRLYKLNEPTHVA